MSKEGRDNTVISREFLICRLTNFETFDAEEEIFIHLDKESFLGNWFVSHYLSWKWTWKVTQSGTFLTTGLGL